MRAAALAVLAGALVAACTGIRSAPPESSMERIEGRVLADPIPADARVEIHRRDDYGLATPLVGFDVRPDGLGHFRTQPLPIGRYLVVLRSREVPPAVSNVRLPQKGPLVLRAPLPSGGSTIVLTSPASRTESLRCRLAAPAPRSGVLDLREVVLAPGQDVMLHGVEPGLWKLDVTNSAATTELAVAPGDAPQRFLVDPPLPAPTDSGVEGTVLARDGVGARGVVVSAWSMSTDGVTLETWGRQSEVGPDGRFQVRGLRPGRGMVRVELRGASHRLLPAPEMIEIPPSGKVERAFRVDP